MKIRIPYEHSELTIPKHCRIPRKVQFKSEITVSIHEVTQSEAPVAIREHTMTFTDKTGKYEPTTIEYRWWGKELWTLEKLQRYSHAPFETQKAGQFTQDPYPMTKGPSNTFYKPKNEVRAGLIGWAKSILFIDGMRWRKAGEPRYVVMTFGLGYNHGGSALMTDNFYNSNIGKSRYFRVDQYQEAVKSACDIALSRGDDQSITSIKKADTYDILIPEAVRLNPGKEHSNGDPFINKLEGMIEASGSKEVAGLLVLKEAVSLVGNLKKKE